VLLIFSEKRRQALSVFAEKERRKRSHRIAALVLILGYNIAGFADILSTDLALMSGGHEANPLLRAAMDGFAWERAWVAVKLAAQLTGSVMIAWFPHRLVLSMLGFVIVLYAATVWGNLSVAGLV